MSLIRGNLLNRALRLIPAQTVIYYQDVGRVDNEIGLYETNLGSNSTDIRGSVQAVPQNSYQQLGLDFGKTYINFFTNTRLFGVERDVSGDVIVWDGKIYQCQSVTDWKHINGWISIIAVATNLVVSPGDNLVVTPEGYFVVTPEGDFVEIPDSTTFVITPEGFFVTTPDDDFIVEPEE